MTYAGTQDLKCSQKLCFERKKKWKGEEKRSRNRIRMDKKSQEFYGALNESELRDGQAGWELDAAMRMAVVLVLGERL